MSHTEPDNPDPLAPARGICNACIISAVFWAIVGLAIFILEVLP